MQKLRWLHRWATVLVVLFALYLGVTGTLIQVTDLGTILSGAPATDANLRSIRESYDGPGDYQVRETRDYLAAPLPAADQLPGLMQQTLAAAREQLGAGALGYVELRMVDGKPVGQVGVGQGHVQLDPATGAVLEKTERDRPENAPQDSPRNIFKHLHRMTTFGDWALIINILASIGLAVLIVTGVIIYLKLLAGRRKIGRPALIWSGGGTWRSLHRSVSIILALFLTIVSLSGAWLAVESAGLAIYMAQHRPPPGQRGPAGAPGGQVRPDGPPAAAPRGMPARKSPITPLVDANVPAMLAATLDAAGRVAPGDPLKVVRLRTYAGYPQGIVVTGGDNSQQLVFDTRDGRSLTTTEPGYPEVPFPFGWNAHQVAKSIHRGDLFGMTGRWVDLISGFAMIYLSVSGMVMYWQMWRKRVGSGRKSFIWK